MQGFVLGNLKHRSVDLVEIDPVSLKTTKRILNRLQDVSP
jgi:hypothetical protein